MKFSLDKKIVFLIIIAFSPSIIYGELNCTHRFFYGVNLTKPKKVFNALECKLPDEILSAVKGINNTRSKDKLDPMEVEFLESQKNPIKVELTSIFSILMYSLIRTYNYCITSDGYLVLGAGSDKAQDIAHKHAVICNPHNKNNGSIDYKLSQKNIYSGEIIFRKDPLRVVINNSSGTYTPQLRDLENVVGLFKSLFPNDAKLIQGKGK